MEFEWDDDKWEENLRVRQIDFAIAAQIFEGPVVTCEDDRGDYGEKRYRAIGRFEEQAYVVAYTFRDEVCHIITAWKVGPKGERRYKALLSRRPPRNA
jgi:uncharacterized DUF497 family protein